MRCAALVPVKPLAAGKSRLATGLDRATVEALTLAMLEDVVAATRGVPAIACTAVVTPDPAVAEAARGAGAQVLLRDDPGLNAALDAGAAVLAEQGYDALLVVLGDVAGAAAGDLAALLDALAAQGGRGAVLAPARDGGTAALLRAPADAIPSCFGPGSAAAHRAAAARAGVAYRELALPSLAIDLDRSEDLRDLLASRGGAPHTRRVLARAGLGAAS